MPKRFSTFKKKLHQLGFSSYVAYLYSKYWQARKVEFAKYHTRKCFVCGCKTKIDLHHKTYIRLGKEKDFDLVWLCRKHHKQVHKSNKKLSIAHIFVRKRYRKRIKYVRTLHRQS